MLSGTMASKQQYFQLKYGMLTSALSEDCSLQHHSKIKIPALDQDGGFSSGSILSIIILQALL